MPVTRTEKARSHKRLSQKGFSIHRTVVHSIFYVAFFLSGFVACSSQSGSVGETQVSILGKAIRGDDSPPVAEFVEVRSEGGRVTGKTAPDGTFQLDVPEQLLQGTVEIEVKGEDDQPRLRSIIGGKLGLNFNSDGSVDTQSNPRLLLDAVSTALAQGARTSSVISLIGQKTEANPSELRALETAADAAKILNLAGLIRLDEGGKQTISESRLSDLISDPIAFNSYLNDILVNRPQDLTLALDSVISQRAELQTLPSASAFVGKKLALISIDPNQRVYPVLDFQSDSRGSITPFHQTFFDKPDAFTWARKSRNQLEIYPDSGFPFTTTTSVPDQEGGFLTITGHIESITLTALGGDLFSGLTNFTYSVSYERSDGLTFSRVFSDYVYRFDLADELKIGAESFEGKRWALPVLDTNSANAGNVALSELFNDFVVFFPGGTAQTEFSDDVFNWTIGDTGRLTLSYTDGNRIEFSVVGIIDSVGYVAIATLSNPEGRVFSGASMIALTDLNYRFEQEGLAGRYHQFGIGTEARFGSAASFVLEFGEDGTGTQERTIISSGTLEIQDRESQPRLGFFFSIGERRLGLRTGLTSDGQLCDPSGTTECDLYDQRIAYPINQIENRVWWLEDRRVGPLPDSEEVRVERPIRFYDRFDDQPIRH